MLQYIWGERERAPPSEVDEKISLMYDVYRHTLSTIAYSWETITFDASAKALHVGSRCLLVFAESWILELASL